MNPKPIFIVTIFTCILGSHAVYAMHNTVSESKTFVLSEQLAFFKRERLGRMTMTEFMAISPKQYHAITGEN